jgi:hypothetical protein
LNQLTVFSKEKLQLLLAEKRPKKQLELNQQRKATTDILCMLGFFVATPVLIAFLE